MGEYIFFGISIIIIYFTNNYLKRFKTTRTEMMLNAISLPVIIGIFSWSLIENFSYRSLIGTCAIVLIASFSFYKTFKKYKRDNNPITE